jgi:K+-sensing histidine kinase KdpD
MWNFIAHELGFLGRDANDGHDRLSPDSTQTIILRSLATLLLVALGTIVIALFDLLLPFLNVNVVTVAYLIVVLVAALWWGIGQAVLAAIAGGLAADFFFYPPIFDFRIEDPQNIADLISFLIVSFVCGKLAGNLRQREREIDDLYRYSKRLATCFTTTDLIEATQQYLSECLGRSALLIEGKIVNEKSVEDIGLPRAMRSAAADMLSRNALGTLTIVDYATHHLWLLWGVALGGTAYVVCVDLGAGTLGGRRSIERRIDAILTETEENLARLDLTNAIEGHKAQAQAETLKDALVATLTHEFRNPLVSILGATSVLDEMARIREDTQARSLVGTVHDEAARLNSDIKNLIDAARITAGVEQPAPILADPVDLVRAAMAQKSEQLAAHRLDVSLAADLPLVRVQPAVIENAFAQLLDNAAKYSPAGSTIRIGGHVEEDSVVLTVSDQGVGFTAEEHPQAGQRSFRSTRHAGAIPGSGLGLWIANTFVVANSGRLEIESAGPGLGTTVRIRLPAARAADLT